jgi:uncharacterized HhH-GPD family protein
LIATSSLPVTGAATGSVNGQASSRARTILGMTTDRLPFTGDDAADQLIAADPLALLIGFALDQQITVQKAFRGPLDLRARIGHLDAARIAATDPDVLVTAFQTPPAIHRFPASMAGKIQALAAAIATDYGNDAARIWTEAADGADLRRRLAALPGFGDMKVASVIAVLAKRLSVTVPGIDAVLPQHPTLGDVDSPEALAAYQAGKRAAKAAAGTKKNG